MLGIYFELLKLWADDSSNHFLNLGYYRLALGMSMEISSFVSLCLSLLLLKCYNGARIHIIKSGYLPSKIILPLFAFATNKWYICSKQMSHRWLVQHQLVEGMPPRPCFSMGTALNLIGLGLESTFLIIYAQENYNMKLKQCNLICAMLIFLVLVCCDILWLEHENWGRK